MAYKYRYTDEKGVEGNCYVDFQEISFPENCQYLIMAYVRVEGDVLSKDKDVLMKQFLYDYCRNNDNKRVVLTGRKEDCDTYKFIKVNKLQVGDETSPAGSLRTTKTGVVMGMFHPYTDDVKKPRFNRKSINNLKLTSTAAW